ncbi:putative triacylglycerol lipase [Dioscorea sansibarensis]
MAARLLFSSLLPLFFTFSSSSSSSPSLQDPSLHKPSHFLVDAVIPVAGDGEHSTTAAPIVAPLPVLPPFPLAPALFVLGDSTVDCGTNNYLGTFARADRPPYGRDFDTHRPTGRFSNGRVIVDFLAERLGLPFVPPYLGRSGRIEDMIHGLNYASAASGILFSSGSDLGQHISLTQQILQLIDTFQQLEMDLGVAATADFISRSVFYISIGSNDFIHYYMQNTSAVLSLFLPWEFNQMLVNTLKQEIKTLYEKNVRKVVFIGIAPIGCTPHYLMLYGSKNGECVDEINNVVIEFNYAMRYMIDELNHELSEAKIIFCDAFNGSMDILANRNLYGFQTTTEACCGLGKYRGSIMCLLPEMACSNASTFVWWDEFHPTDAVNRILANNIWSSEHTDMCHPMNLLQMISSGH